MFLLLKKKKSSPPQVLSLSDPALQRSLSFPTASAPPPANHSAAQTPFPGKSPRTLEAKSSGLYVLVLGLTALLAVVFIIFFHDFIYTSCFSDHCFLKKYSKASS